MSSDIGGSTLSGRVISNSGESSEFTVTIGQSNKSQSITVYVVEDHNIKLQLGENTQVFINGVSSAVNGVVESNTVGSHLTLYGADDGNWYGAGHGTWDVDSQAIVGSGDPAFYHSIVTGKHHL